MTHFSFESIGTFWQIDIEGDISHDARSTLQEAIHQRIECYDKTYSRFRDDSLITAIAKESGTYSLPMDSHELFSTYRQIYNSTHGAVTPLIGQLLSDAGYDATYSLKPKELLSPPLPWDDVMTYKDTILTMKKTALLDFGAAGKGHLIDIVGELIEKHGYNSYCVDAGSDIRHRTNEEKNLTIGLEHPTDTEQILGVAKLRNASLCGSAGNRRAWGDYHHILDPRTLKPVVSVLAVWTVSPSTILADALSTCLFFVEPSTLKEEYTFEYVLVRPDFSVEHSREFPGELFIQ